MAQPYPTLLALLHTVGAVAPERLQEMFAKMEEDFAQTGEQGSIIPIDMFYREWSVIAVIESHPEMAHRLHAAEHALMSNNPEVRDAAIRDAGEIVRAAHRIAQPAGGTGVFYRQQAAR
jgi:hypothetical protein